MIKSEQVDKVFYQVNHLQNPSKLIMFFGKQKKYIAGPFILFLRCHNYTFRNEKAKHAERDEQEDDPKPPEFCVNKWLKSDRYLEVLVRFNFRRIDKHVSSCTLRRDFFPYVNLLVVILCQIERVASK